MSSTQSSSSTPVTMPTAAQVDYKLEVVVLPVADVGRAKQFYESLGWRVDADFSQGDSWHVVQMTPPGSPCSVHFGKGYTTATPGSVQGTFLAVQDVDAARADLIARGVAVSDVFHFSGGLHVSGSEGRVPGRDPQGRTYSSWASFSDPDGNTWLLQEITTRLPGRGVSSADVGTRTELLRDAEQRHGAYEASAPEHHWSEWYAAYIVAREQGRSEEAAAQEGARNVEARR
jgi:catechol 2,3-dioxygenase-like lactoylglutathione lyase family enzyme